MKNLQLLLVLLTLVAIGKCESDGGYSLIRIPGNYDPGACRLNLNVSLTSACLVFTEVVTDNNIPDCSYQNLTFDSMFRDDFSVTGSVDLLNTSTPNVLKGNLYMANVTTYNGTACLTLGNNFYTCRFKYGYIYIQVAWFMSSAGDIDTNWTDLLFPAWGTNITNVSGKVEMLKPNTEIVLRGLLFEGCENWDTAINNMSSNIIITGNNRDVGETDLNQWLSKYWISSIIIRQNGAAKSNYKVYNPTTVIFPFATPSSNKCSTLPITWTDLLGDCNYCKDGCYLTFVLLADQVYILETNSITTPAPGSLRT